MDNKQRTLLALVAKNTFNQKNNSKLTKEVEVEARVQGVHGLVNPHAYDIIRITVPHFCAHAQLHYLLKDIPYVILKGCASAYYYPNPYLRSMGDVDFLIHPEDMRKVENIFVKHGFTLDHETSLHKCYINNGMVYEIHTSINGIPKAYKHCERLLQDIFQESKIINTECGEMIIPSDYHAGLICLFHIVEHLITTGIGIRHLCDWACYIRRLGPQGDMLRGELEEVGLWKFMQLLSLTCVKYLGIDYQQWMGTAKDELLEDIIDEFFLCGNFGKNRKSEDEWLVVYTGSNGEIRQFFSSLAEATKLHWPCAKKHRFLIPFGCVYFGARYVISILKGKHEMVNLYELSRKTKRRNHMYKKLGLFRKTP